ncbi:hypothetical protein E2562_022006 [Oryza meyeriana var. granulata]|uniref:Uncharacterized protein n=1 Tax=Oryza meyeriana var. granulata TaxID=110450 RepID=A0A6G1ENF2_9ORYZ|nr:hypothetical protein E2562_022006 [Oryza meyeriana var. granulata]
MRDSSSAFQAFMIPSYVLLEMPNKLLLIGGQSVQEDRHDFDPVYASGSKVALMDAFNYTDHYLVGHGCCRKHSQSDSITQRLGGAQGSLLWDNMAGNHFLKDEWSS